METSYINCYEVLTYSYKTIITNISSPTTATIFSTQKLPYIGVYRIPLFWTDPNDVSFFSWNDHLYMHIMAMYWGMARFWNHIDSGLVISCLISPMKCHKMLMIYHDISMISPFWLVLHHHF